MPDEVRILEQTVKEYCASKTVTLSELCGGADHTKHNKSVRNAWKEIAQCLPHRTVLSIYRRARRQFHGHTRGPWSQEEVSTLFRLVEALFVEKKMSMSSYVDKSNSACVIFGCSLPKGLAEQQFLIAYLP